MSVTRVSSDDSNKRRVTKYSLDFTGLVIRWEGKEIAVKGKRKSIVRLFRGEVPQHVIPEQEAVVQAEPGEKGIKTESDSSGDMDTNRSLSTEYTGMFGDGSPERPVQNLNGRWKEGRISRRSLKDWYMTPMSSHRHPTLQSDSH